MTEIWKDIDGYEGLYQVSNLGRVKSLHHNKEKILKGSYANKGYHLISLSKEGTQKRYLVHRLVATAFIPNPYKLECVNHKDENPRNNNVNNLLSRRTQSMRKLAELFYTIVCNYSLYAYNPSD